MRKKTTAIPVNYMATESGDGIAIERVSFTDLQLLNDGGGAHRHNGHSFFLLESGSISVEIDFQTYMITAPSVIYIHPDQVHRTMTAESVTVSSLAITDENLKSGYRAILDGLTPAKPLALGEEIFSLISGSVSLCLKFSQRKTDKLHHAMLMDGCNALVALVISQYLEQGKSIEKPSRFEIVHKAFRKLLERDFTKIKSPADYAEKLNISGQYLNECVKNTTGYSASCNIQQRVILEAKRLLSHSDITVKEVAVALGYDDYPYFSRLFTKVTGTTALAFRNKNRY